MIRYSLPDFTRHLRLNLMMVDFMRKSPEIFWDDIEISSLYGNFPGCIMNGGRIMHEVDERYTPAQIAETFDTLSNRGLTARLTLTNMVIRPEQYDDEYCRTILEAARGHDVEIIVNQDELADYVSSRYHFRRILSTTRALDGVEELNRMLDRYDMVVLDYNHNKDDLFLKQVSDPSRLEVMPNELCRPGCQARQEHYLAVSRHQLTGERDFHCPNSEYYEKSGYTGRTQSSPTILGNDDIRRLNAEYGISNFKIVGRLHTRELLLESYVYYLIRPEYRSVILEIIRKKLGK